MSAKAKGIDSNVVVCKHTPMAAWQRSRLFGYWKEISASRTDEGDERSARAAYASEKLGRPIGSWTELTKEDAGKLIHAMRQDLGREDHAGLSLITHHSSLHVRADALEIIAKLALDLYGSATWYEQLQERLTQRPFFHYGKVDQITPRQSHELIEILLDHLERKLFPDDAPMETRGLRKEEMRKRFSPQSPAPSGAGQRRRGAKKG